MTVSYSSIFLITQKPTSILKSFRLQKRSPVLLLRHFRDGVHGFIQERSLTPLQNSQRKTERLYVLMKCRRASIVSVLSTGTKHTVQCSRISLLSEKASP